MKRIGDVEGDVMLTAGIVVVGVIGIKYLLASFGSSAEDSATVANQHTVTPAQNPFNPSFQPFLDNWNAYQQGNTVADGMTTFYAEFQAGTLPAGTDSFQIATWADTLKSALSVWNWTVDTNAVFSVFSQMVSQIQCANLAAYVSYNFNKDLLTWLHYGGSPVPWVPNGLSDSQVAIIVNQINALPVLASH